MAPMSDDTRDRVIRLETQVGHLTDKLEDMDAKVTEMHSLLLQAKGVRWLIIGAATIGGFLSAKLGALAPWLSLPPR